MWFIHMMKYSSAMKTWIDLENPVVGGDVGVSWLRDAVFVLNLIVMVDTQLCGYTGFTESELYLNKVV